MSKYREIDSSAFSSETTWMNLGYWKSENDTFEKANETLARVVGQLARKQKPKASIIIDIGCGRGDSLNLWISEEFNFKKVLGVNSSRSEYLQASKRFETDKRINLFFSDAIDFVERPMNLKNFVLVSIDAMYHFTPSREEFLFAASKTGASCLSASDIILSEKWSRESNKLDFITTFFRKIFIGFISLAAGVPLENLSYGPSRLSMILKRNGWNIVHQETITKQVFLPFSKNCKERAKGFSWFSKTKWTLLSSAWFMSLLDFSGAVDFVLFSAEPIDSVVSTTKLD